MQNKEADFTKLQGAMLIATFFSLWLAVYFEHAVENLLAYILILSFGMLHGANDIKLLQVEAKKKAKPYDFLRILAYYIFFVLGVAGLFYLLPSIALGLFILFSAYHFGEQHWISKIRGNPLFLIFFFTVYGLVILFLLFAAHHTEVSDIIFDIIGIYIDSGYYQIILGISFFILVVLYLTKYKQNTANILLELFYLLVFFIVFNTASLLWAFAIFFILWHAIPSLGDQITYLYGDLSKKHFIKYVRSSLIYWLASVITLVILFLFIDGSSEGFIPFLFSFLAAITFPHVLVISRLNKS
ncbi:Brp/Blh family beta-carotene 15,15'-dioxygenase [uncultured Eudoraea sp.]|uniref:Brp/Blh family beta-carotene 15,15'-dioxygenase n=1 Tax=uncultured Eudoraea sp. TaxID=1035614 RepID=UPI002615E675|nr:Brp/Blh family beta-carotene 15,15'-dioxygenase [uncultured Eudoraea sp.]